IASVTHFLAKLALAAPASFLSAADVLHAFCASLPIGRLIVRVNVVVGIEVELHLLSTLRWPAVLFLELLRGLWPVLARVNGGRLAIAFCLETHRVQDVLVGHLR